MKKKKAKLPSTPTGRKRLLKLADLLTADARRKRGIQFDMSTWGVNSAGKVEANCNTRACAMGLAAISGAFAKQGLGARYETARFYPWLDITMNGRTIDGVAAARRLFEISEREADFLFIYGANVAARGGKDEKALARAIKEFVKGNLNWAIKGLTYE